MSKKVYTIAVSGLISYYVGGACEVEAPDLSTAKEEAITKFREALDEEIGWYEFEELKAEALDMEEAQEIGE